jgi:Glycosyl transferases group 1
VSPGPDVLLVSLSTTHGWRVGDELLAGQLRAAGLEVALVRVGIGASGRLRRGYPANDLVEALAARRTIASAAGRLRPRAAILSTTTAAMLAPPLDMPYAVRFDAPAAMNRPGARNALLPALERRAMRAARLLLPWSERALEALGDVRTPAVVLPPPIVPSGPRDAERERVAVAYVPDPKAKGLEVVCAGWSAAGVEGARLEVFGLEREWALGHLERTGVPAPPRVEWRGLAPADEFRAALRRATVYVGGARWEDFGQAPLEALADGALLVTVPSGGPFEALAIARELEPTLVAGDVDGHALARPIRTAFEMGEERARSYRAAAAERLARFRPEAVREAVAERVVPALLG